MIKIYKNNPKLFNEMRRFMSVKKNKEIKLLSFSIYLCLIIITTSSCNYNPVITEAQPGRRDYTWTIDTLNIYYPSYKIWGSSPTDVYSINGSDFSHGIWHYEGHMWSTDGISRNILPHAIFGFSYNNIYIGGSNGGEIWRFDGKNWSQFAELTKAGQSFVAFENIWGSSPNDFFAVGSGPDNKGYFNNSVIAHFTNNEWEILNTDEIKGDVVHLYKNQTDSKTYLRLTRIGGGEFADSTIIYEYTLGKYNELYSSVQAIGIQADISLINGEVYFILGDKVAERINNQFQIVLQVDNPNFCQRIWGRSSIDIFLLMTDGLVHYNGSDMQYLFKFDKQGTQIYDAAIFEKEVFFVAYEAQDNIKIIYHGKLKE